MQPAGMNAGGFNLSSWGRVFVVCKKTMKKPWYNAKFTKKTG